MLRVKVGRLKEGQVLLQDVTRSDGVVLMAKGRVVSEDVIRLLERMEVESVVVDGDLFDSEEARQAYLAEQEAELYRRFSRVEDDPLLMGVRELFRRRLHKSAAPVAGGSGQKRS